MSITNMYHTLQGIKSDQRQVINVTADVQDMKTKIASISNLHDQHSVLSNQVTAALDMIGKLSKTVDALTGDLVTKDMLKQNLDEVSLCFSEFITQATPRPQSDERLNDIEKRLTAIEQKLSSGPDTSKIVMRQALDIDASPQPVTVPQLSLFTKPTRKRN